MEKYEFELVVNEFEEYEPIESEEVEADDIYTAIKKFAKENYLQLEDCEEGHNFAIAWYSNDVNGLGLKYEITW